MQLILNSSHPVWLEAWLLSSFSTFCQELAAFGAASAAGRSLW
jgi:hypothetical protein